MKSQNMEGLRVQRDLPHHDVGFSQHGDARQRGLNNDYGGGVPTYDSTVEQTLKRIELWDALGRSLYRLSETWLVIPQASRLSGSIWDWCCTAMWYMEVSQKMWTFLFFWCGFGGVPIIGIVEYWGLYWGPLFRETTTGRLPNIEVPTRASYSDGKNYFCTYKDDPGFC